MFENAVRNKFRFTSNIGVLNVEDLWDLSLQNLNTLAKLLRKELRNLEEEDFLEITSEKDQLVKSKFDIVIHILNVKKAEAEDRKNAAARKAEKQQLLEILNRKQTAGLENLTEEQLLARINEL